MHRQVLHLWFKSHTKSLRIRSWQNYLLSSKKLGWLKVCKGCRKKWEAVLNWSLAKRGKPETGRSWHSCCELLVLGAFYVVSIPSLQTAPSPATITNHVTSVSQTAPNRPRSNDVFQVEMCIGYNDENMSYDDGLTTSHTDIRKLLTSNSSRVGSKSWNPHLSATWLNIQSGGALFRVEHVWQILLERLCGSCFHLVFAFMTLKWSHWMSLLPVSTMMQNDANACLWKETATLSLRCVH